MQLRDIVKILDAEIITENDDSALDIDVHTACGSDMMSDGFGQSAGCPHVGNGGYRRHSFRERKAPRQNDGGACAIEKYHSHRHAAKDVSGLR